MTPDDVKPRRRRRTISKVFLALCSGPAVEHLNAANMTKVAVEFADALLATLDKEAP